MSSERTFDWKPRFDPQSRRYGVAEVAGNVPAEIPYRTWDIPVWLDQGQEGACFPAGTFIRMADGSHKKIEDVRTLDEVVTAEGRTGRVLQTMVRRGSELVHINLRGHLRAFASTPEHPVLVQRNIGSRRKKTEATLYLPADEIKVGDRVCLTRYLPTEDSPLPLAALVSLHGMRGVISGVVQTGSVTSEVAPLPTMVGRTPDLGRLFGLYAAEGNTTPNKVTWSFGSHEVELINETCNLIKTCFGAIARLQVRPNNSTNVVLYGKTWRLLFETLIPGTSKHGDKHLSRHVTTGSKVYLTALLNGWLDGDGHRRRHSVAGITVCPRLAFDMYAIATGLGLKPALRVSAPQANQYALTRQNRWEVEIAEGQGKNTPEETDTAVWRKVMSINRTTIDEWVYNLHVEGDESYIANGFGVHNCVGFGSAHRAAAMGVTVSEQIARSLYLRAQQIDEWEGESYEGTSVLAGTKAAVELSWFDSYWWDFSERQLAWGIASMGPAVIGVNWYQGMTDVDSRGYITPTGPFVGGHCVCVYGYEFPGVYRIRNSWSRDWGIDGDCLITATDMDLLIRQGAELCHPMPIVAPLPPQNLYPARRIPVQPDGSMPPIEMFQPGDYSGPVIEGGRTRVYFRFPVDDTAPSESRLLHSAKIPQYRFTHHPDGSLSVTGLIVSRDGSWSGYLDPGNVWRRL